MWRNWQQYVDPAIRLIVTLSLLLGGLKWTASTEAAVSPPIGFERAALADETATPVGVDTATETATSAPETTEAVTTTPELMPSPSETPTPPLPIKTPVPSATPGPAATTETAPPAASLEPTPVSETPGLDFNGPAQPNLSLLFVENVGQVESRPGSPGDQPRFVSRSDAGTLYLAPNAIWLSVVEMSAPEESLTARAPSGDSSLATPPPPAPQTRQGVSLRLTFTGAKKHPEIIGLNRSGAHISYFYGNDPAQWQTDVPAYEGVRYVDLYPGLDLEITSENGQWVWRFLVKDDSFLERGNPKALEKIRLRVEGVNELGVEKARLNLATLVGDVSLPLLDVVEAAGDSRGRPLPRGEARARVDKDEIIAPFAELPEPGGNRPGPGLAAQIARPRPEESTRVLAQTGSNSAGLLIYSSFIGGNGGEGGRDIAVNGTGAAYIVGTSDSNPTQFPISANAYDASNGGADSFLIVVQPNGSGVYYSSYHSGLGIDIGRSVALDSLGRVYLTGFTNSTVNWLSNPTSGFPITAGAFQTAWAGDYDAFVARVKIALPAFPPSQAFAVDECPFCNNNVRALMVGDNVNAYSGNFNYQQADGSTQALGGDLQFNRSYNSLWRPAITSVTP